MRVSIATGYGRRVGGRRAPSVPHAVKRARYAADLAAHEFGRPGERFVAGAKQLQDIHEVDEARWLPAGEAEELLTYERDLDVLRVAAR